MKNRLKGVLEDFPRLYLEIVRFKRRGHWSREWVVSRDTEIVIEGFPRSANSFARSAFRSCQPDVRYATHVHSPAQIVQACRWGIPTLVLLRDPEGAACGDVAFHCELAKVDPVTLQPAIIESSLERYIRFYEKVLPWSDSFVVGHFPEVTKDFGEIIRRINRKFGTSFVVFEHTDDSAAEVKGRASHIGPQANRELIKSVIREKFRLQTSSKLKEEADIVYRRLLAAQGLA